MNKFSITLALGCSAIIAAAMPATAVAASIATPTTADTEIEDDTSTHVEADVAALPGIDISTEDFKQYLTTGQPQTDPKKVFVIYNVGQRKFLSLGGYWGTHAALSDVPHLFWLQRRNEKTELQNAYVRYPETPDEVIPSQNGSNYITKLMNLTQLQIGSMEGGSRSYAKYNYVRLVNEDNSFTNILDEGYAPNGETFIQETAFAGKTQHIEMELDLSGCTGKSENIMSVGSDIAKWIDANNKGNLHIYYTKSTHDLEIDYVDNTITNGTKKHITVDDSQPMTLSITKDGLLVNGTMQLAVGHTPEIKYDEKLAGDIVRFRVNERGEFVTDEDGTYIIDQENGKGYSTQQDTYVYTYSSRSEGIQTYFLASRFTKANPTKNEGNFLGRNIFDPATSKYGDIGIFGDRDISFVTRENSQWSFDRVEGRADNVYTLSLTFSAGKDFVEQIIDDSADAGYINQTTTLSDKKQLFLQATKQVVKSSNLKDGTGGNGLYGNEEDITATCAEALDKVPSTLANPEDAYWKIISMQEYYRLLNNDSKDMNESVDFTFIIGDNNFNKEHKSLNKWQTEGLDEPGMLMIGLDGYYKTQTTDQAYVNTWGSNLNPILSNHGRCLGVKIGNGGRGRFYQDLQVYYPGWYTIQCSGMTNAGARLFVQRKDGDELSEPTTMELVAVGDEEIDHFNATNLQWPYTVGMPMYNALIDMNETNINGGENVKKYTNEVKIFIGNASEESPVTLRFGVEVADEANLIPLWAPRVRTYTAESPDKEWTVFDNFHLLFNGRQELPELILSEDYTDLNYIENADYTYDLQPLHLKRTFSKGDENNWNTIILPVALTESQVKQTFGENTQLAKLYDVTDKSVRFVYETANVDGVLLRAFTPYLIKPDNTQGTAEAYSFELAVDGKSVTKQIDAGHFYINSATLAGKMVADDGKASYPFSKDYANYVVTAEAANKSQDAALGVMTAHGTLCKTYEQAGTIIYGRPRLDSGNAYIMKDNVMYRVPQMQNGYGLRGMRCWFEFTPAQNQSKPAELGISINGIDDSTTTINDVLANDGIYTINSLSDGIYTMSGQKIAPANADINTLPSGLYIVNGKKYMKQ